MLTDAQIERYARQLLLPEIGGAGQERLLSSRVVLEGEGVAAEMCRAYLVAAGVGSVSCRAGAPARLSVRSGAPSVVLEAAYSQTTVAVARGRCLGCVEASLQIPETTSVLAPAAAAVAGTLVATETLEVLLGRASLEGQVLRLDLAHGKPSRAPLSPCSQCRRTQ